MSRYRSGRGDSGARDGNRKSAELSIRGSHFVVAPSWNGGMDRSRTPRFWEVVSFLIHPRGGQVARYKLGGEAGSVKFAAPNRYQTPSPG